ncbi:MAG: hypothetical protein RLZZ267_67 [Bacillota bacterium]
MSQSEKLFLLPIMVEQYRNQLSDCLKEEQFGEAIALLRFLQNCELKDTQLKQEWEQLRVVLETEFPELVDEPALTERDVMRQIALQKADKDEDYIDKLVEMFIEGDDLRPYALEQLGLLEYPLLQPMLLKWLEKVEREPFVQWMALQELRRLGHSEPIRMIKYGNAVTVDPEAIAIDESGYPAIWAEVGGLAFQVAEQQDPSVMEMIPSWWMSYYVLQFGSPEFQEWLERMNEEPALWAFLLHTRVAELVHGEFDIESLAGFYELQDIEPERLLGAIEFMKTLK